MLFGRGSDFLEIHIALTRPDKKVFKMIFGMSAIVLQRSQGLVLFIFLYSSLKVA